MDFSFNQHFLFGEVVNRRGAWKTEVEQRRRRKVRKAADQITAAPDFEDTLVSLVLVDPVRKTVDV